MAVLLIDGVGKQYERDRWALRDIWLRLETGVLGLVGPNGAGKTTLLRILATMLSPTTGVVTWEGLDITRHPDAVRRTLGYLPQDFGVYPQLTAREFLTYIGELKGLSGAVLRRRVEAVLETVHLHSDAGRRLRSFSGGMVRRVGIAQALLNEPRLLVLDEPTAGLDPAERAHLRTALSSLGGERLVILSTHIMADVAVAATDLALLQHGHLVWTGTPEGLRADAEGRVWSLTVPAPELARLQATHTICTATPRGEGMEVRLLAPAQPHPLAVPVPPTLEDAHLLFVDDNAARAAPEACDCGYMANHATAVGRPDA